MHQCLSGKKKNILITSCHTVESPLQGLRYSVALGDFRDSKNNAARNLCKSSKRDAEMRPSLANC